MARNVDKVQFPYRSAGHLVLLHVIQESGAWDRYGLEVDYDRHISSSDAHKLVPKGEVEFVGGNHVSTYGNRARGDSWVYLGQTVNFVDHSLIVRPDSGIETLADLKGKKFGSRGSHPSLNDWLFLKQNGLDVDRGEIEIINYSAYKKGTMDPVDQAAEDKKRPVWQEVRDGNIDACLSGPPITLFAEAAGMKIIKVPALPMIQFTTISSSLGFVEKNPQLVDRFLKGMIDGIHYFKTRKEESIRIIKNRFIRQGQMTDAQAEYTWASTARILEPKLFPQMKAISNVYEEALRQDKDAHRVNPMELWDLHHIRRIDDQGFVKALYDGARPDGAALAAAATASAGLLDPHTALDHTDCEICASGGTH